MEDIQMAWARKDAQDEHEQEKDALTITKLSEKCNSKHNSLVRMAIIKKPQTTRLEKVWRKGNPLILYVLGIFKKNYPKLGMITSWKDVKRWHPILSMLCENGGSPTGACITVADWPLPGNLTQQVWVAWTRAFLPSTQVTLKLLGWGPHFEKCCLASS